MSRRRVPKKRWGDMAKSRGVNSGGHRSKRAARGAGYAGQSKKKFGADKRRSAHKLADPRRQDALEDARKAQERLERRIAREQEQPSMGAAAGASYSPPPQIHPIEPPATERPPPAPSVAGGFPTPVEHHPRALRFPELPWEGEGAEDGAIGRARQLLRQGYNIRKVVKDTGVGMKWLDDIPVDRAGFGEE